jgi:rRNA maturation endonuclease Nob1
MIFRPGLFAEKRIVHFDDVDWPVKCGYCPTIYDYKLYDVCPNCGENMPKAVE